MALSPVTLVSLGLCLGPAWPAHTGPLLKPLLKAKPSALVPQKTQVTLKCLAPPGMDVYRLEKLGSATYMDQTVLSIPAMTQEAAGRYRCSYQNGTHWSPASDQLELVVTGVYDKPALFALSSSTVPQGSNVTLRCQTKHGFDQFALDKEGAVGPVKQSGRWYSTDFLLVSVRPEHSGIYRCYSFSNSAPYLWSAPSNPLELMVTGASGTRSQQSMNAPALALVPALASAPASALAPTPAPEFRETIKARNSSVLNQVSSGEPTRKTPKTPKGPPTAPGLPHQHYATGNVARMCLGAVTVVLLGGVLLEDWHSRRRVRRAGALRRPLPQPPHSPTGPRVGGSKDGISALNPAPGARMKNGVTLGPLPGGSTHVTGTGHE